MTSVTYHLEPKNFCVVPLRDIVIFPHSIVPLFVGREKSVRALEEAAKYNKPVILVAQKDPMVDDPKPDEVYRVGVLADILQLLRLPDGTMKLLVEAKQRAHINYFLENEKFYQAEIELIGETHVMDKDFAVLSRTLINIFETYVKYSKKLPKEIVESLKQIEDIERLTDTISMHLVLGIAKKQEILEIKSMPERIDKILEIIEKEVQLMGAEDQIRSRIRNQMEKSHKEYFLNEQMKAIKKELGDEEEPGDELEQLKKRIDETKFSKEAREKANAEFKKLKKMNVMSSEATVVRSYLEWLLDIPWGKRSRVNYDLKRAQTKLDKDHYGLDKIKERIIEYLAVQKRTKSLKGPILCLVGPPGVGKTSLARSVAEATGRNYINISLGGVRDESEIRGHRRTYIGSLPGKLIQSMKKCKTVNPLILLDEIDKMGSDFRGDPAAALLEVLDPEQNHEFGDHYLEVDYDLSDVMFITTANTMNMPRPLMDRMEIIRLSGYTEDEKIEIARAHLIPKQAKNHGIKKGEWEITDQGLRQLIEKYTRESGVRNLEREIAKLMRKSVRELVENETIEQIEITEDNLKDYAGIERFDHNVIENDNHIGVTTGLAYTEVGGDLLPIEAVLIPSGSGKITLTGKLGDVMQESAQAAWSYVRSRAEDFGIQKDSFTKYDIHIHVPEGATPKDGPSAGAALCTSIVSALTNIPVNQYVAMTGEISLRGMVMPIGGLKEKLLAALRGGIKKVLIPEKNVKDLEEIPDNVKNAVEIIPVITVSQVLEHALLETLEPISWESEIKLVTQTEELSEPSSLRH